jgi:DNA-binding transcriptional LysR family regulator
VMRRDHPMARKKLTLDAFCAAHHLQVSFSGRPLSLIDRALADMGRRRRIVLTVNQFFTAGRVVTQSDLLTVLPLSFLAATGRPGELATRELPFDPGAVHVEMVWHLRRDNDPAHRWLREVLHSAVQAPA